MLRFINIIICFFFLNCLLFGQKKGKIFQSYKIEDWGPVNYYELLLIEGGSWLVTTSYNFCIVRGDEFNFFILEKDKKYGTKNEKNIFPENPDDTIKTFAYSKDGYLFFVTHDNQIVFDEVKTGRCDLPPFYFPPKGEVPKDISKIWIDEEENLYVGTTEGACYFVREAASKETLGINNYKLDRGKDSNIVVIKGEKPVRKITLSPQARVYSFAQDRMDKNIIWIGTNKGLFSYHKITGKTSNILPAGLPGNDPITITHMETRDNGDIWFSTLERGMGLYYYKDKNFKFYPYPRKQKDGSNLYPINTFCIKSSIEFFVAVMDSLPAIFNTQSRIYRYIDDSSFNETKNSTTDIKIDQAGNLFLIKGGILYSCNAFDDIELAATNSDSTSFVPIITRITSLNGEEIASPDHNPEHLEKLNLKYNQGSFIVYYYANYFSRNKKVQFKWKADGYINNWLVMPVVVDTDSSFALLRNLQPGKYFFQVKVRIGDGEWSNQDARLEIVITPPFWQTWWFWTTVIIIVGAIISILLRWRIKVVKKREREKFAHQKEILELEAKALRAQMNPHFIFNCMNSIKSLIQQHEEDKAVTYLTTFSKLIRTLFNNADKKEISLYDEVETCKLYLQLEAMRFDTGFTYNVQVNESLDLKSVSVPALVVQPFIENAIWHGIVPRGLGGHINLVVQQANGNVEIIIDDNGIGRESSRQNKSASSLVHQSKGVNLTQSRLELDNLLKQRRATLETVDKKNEDGTSKGTKVILHFNEQLL